jgi:hypothetical protein
MAHASSWICGSNADKEIMEITLFKKIALAAQTAGNPLTVRLEP